MEFILGVFVGVIFVVFILALIYANGSDDFPLDIRYDYELGYKDGYNDAKAAFAPKVKGRDKKGGS